MRTSGLVEVSTIVRLGTILFIAGACQANGPSVATLFPDVPAFATLTDVRPGMSIGSLWTTRKPQIAPYLGFTEVSAGDTIDYVIADPPYNDQGRGHLWFLAEKILKQETVIGVDVWERIADADSAHAKWANRVTALAERNKVEPTCFTSQRAGLSTTALVQQGDRWLGVQLIDKRESRGVGGSYVSPPTLITFATMRMDRYAPPRFTREPFRCPSGIQPASVAGVSPISPRASTR